MAEESTQNGAAAPAETPEGPTFTVEKIYVKDVSFEAPSAPQVFSEQGQVQPQLQLNLNQRVQRLSEDVFEVVLGITLTCNADDKPLYLVEVQQAGVFGLRGFEPAQTDALLGTQCPTMLYPYARQLISDLVQSGGFPPFYLQPINFDALYAEGLKQRAQQNQAATDGSQGGGASPAGLADAETAGNA